MKTIMKTIMKKTILALTAIFFAGFIGFSSENLTAENTAVSTDNFLSITTSISDIPQELTDGGEKCEVCGKEDCKSTVYKTKTENKRLKVFKEKSKVVADEKMINGGFFVFKKEFLDQIPDDPGCDLEREPLETLTAKKQLSVYRHKNFWQCMDTYRDYTLLNDLWTKNFEWKIW